MNRKLLNGLLVLTVATGGVVTFTSCKDDDFRTNTVLTETSLQAQIDAIRQVKDEEFKIDLEAWLNNWTSTIQGSGFKSYEDMVQCANAMYKIYDDIMNNYPNVSDETLKYVQKLYDWMFDNKIQASDWYDLIFALSGRASSVEVSQVANPVFGSINLPLDVKSTILATYVYSASSSFTFPTQFYLSVADASPVDVDASEALGLNAIIKGLNPKDAVALSGTKFTDNGDMGNMGAAVLTINPSSNDYTDASKYTIELVNSKGDVAFTTAGENASMKLTEYDDLLYFGHNKRSENAPGVYALNVNVDDKTYSNFTVDLDKSALKDALEMAIKDHSISSLAHLSETVFENVNNKLPAYAVKVSWKENVVDQTTGDIAVDENGEPLPPIINSVYSGFDLAAAAIHPLSYNTDVAHVMPNKQIPILHNTLVEYLEKIQNKIDVEVDVDKVGKIKIEFNAVLTDRDIDGNIFYDENGNKQWKVMFEYRDEDTGETAYGYFDYDINGIVTESKENMEELQSFVDAILGAMNMELQGDLNWKLKDTFNKINDKIKDYQGRVNDYLDRIKNSNKLEYAQKILDYFTDFAKRANKVLKNPNHYLQVVLGYSFGDGPHYMSTDIKMPLEVNIADGDHFDVITTSYTADIVVPSYKKYVAVTGVVNDNYTISTDGLASLNTGDLNTVYSGQEEKIQIPLTPLKGKTVRLTYISVDYRGKCSLQNYYMKVN